MSGPLKKGPDTFVFSINDLYGQSSTAAVTITVNAVNQAPVVSTVIASTDAGSPVTLHVLASASDPDGDTLSVTSVTQGQNGAVTLNADGTATYAPADGFAGPDSFTFSVSDGHGHSTLGLANLTVYAAGQWASAVEARSSEQASSGPGSALAALGPPDVLDGSDTSNSWVPSAGTAIEFLTVGFAVPASATGVLVREAAGAGSITEIDLTDIYGNSSVAWQGTDPTSGSDPVDFVLQFPATDYQVAAVTVYVNGQSAPAIDAVRLLTGGSPNGVTISSQGLDSNTGQYVVTAYSASGKPSLVDNYANGVLVQSTADQYDSNDNLSVSDVTNYAGGVTHTEYDSAGHTTSQTLGYGSSAAARTTYQYNSSGNMTSLTDPDNNTTTWTYDAQGNETSMTDPLSNTETRTYDSQGRLETVLSRNNLLTTYSYDDAGRLATETWFNGSTTSSSVADTLTWSYNAAGQLVLAGKSDGTNTYTYGYDYDDQGRVSHVDEPFGVSLTFSYDQWGNRNLVLDSFGDEEQSLYNEAGQLMSRTLTVGSQQLRLEFTYTQSGQIATITRYSDLARTQLVAVTSYQYDASGNVTQIASTDANGNPIDEFDYVYDPSGQLTSEIDNGVETDYSYDMTGQLTAAGSTTYTYDANGNRNSSGNTVGGDNQLLTDGTYDYTYDANGNETTKVTIATGDKWTYGYDNANEMISAVETAADGTVEAQATYTYDVFGNRIEKDVWTAATGTVVTKFAQDGWNPALGANPVGSENWNVWADLDADGSLQAPYLRGDRVDELFAEVSAPVQWTITDRLGSVRDLVTNSGQVADRISYDAFGAAVASAPSDNGRYGFTGRELDTESGLQFNRARYYDSDTGRWLGQDPVRFAAGDSNLYRYVHGAVLSFTDPSGLLLEIGPPTAPLLIDAAAAKTNAAGAFADPTLKGIATTIAEEMATAKKRTLSYADVPSFQLDLRIRTYIYRESTSLSNTTYQFSANGKELFVTKGLTNWEDYKTGVSTGSRIKSGKSAYAGINEIFKAPKGALIRYDCNTAAELIYLKAFADILGKAKFDAAFAGLSVAGGKTPKNVIQSLFNTVSITDTNSTLVTGDQVTFVSIGTNVTGWLHENTIYLGGNLFFAHMPNGPVIEKQQDLSKAIQQASGRQAKPQTEWYILYRQLKQNLMTINGGGEPLPYYSVPNLKSLQDLMK